MTNNKPRLVIADPSLVDARGHHYTLTRQITRGAEALGLEVIWFVHKDFVAQASDNPVSFYPVFSATMYDRYRPEKKKTLASDLDQRLLDELMEGIARSGIGAHDHIYFHTAFGDLYQALPRYAAGRDWVRRPYLHVCTPYDPLTMPGKDSTEVLLKAIESIRTLEAVDRKIFFWAETPQLAQYYTRHYGFNVRGLLLPPPQGIEAHGVSTNSDIFTALYLGAAREEKGFVLLPELAERLYERYGKTGRLRFVIQCTPQIIGYLPAIKKTMDRLRTFPSEYVSLIDTVMEEDAYFSYLRQSDLVLLMYDKNNYRIRGSGIAIEAICAGKCILTHKDTFCASLISNGGGFAVDDVAEASEKLAEMIENKALYGARAQEQGQIYRASNSVERYAERLMRQASDWNRVPFFPSTVAGYVSPNLLMIS